MILLILSLYLYMLGFVIALYLQTEGFDFLTFGFKDFVIVLLYPVTLPIAIIFSLK